MGIKIMMGIVNIPIMLIMHGCVLFMGREKNGRLFGITLRNMDSKSEEIRRIKEKFKRNLWIVSALCLAVYVLACMADRDSVVVSITLVQMMMAVFLYFVPMIAANKQMNVQKSRFVTEEDKENVIKVDMTVAAEKPKLSFWKVSVVGTVATVLVFAAELIFNIDEKLSDVRVLIVGILATCGVIYLLAGKSTEKVRDEIYSRDSRVNLMIARVKSYQWGRFTAVCIWVNFIYTVYMCFRMEQMSENIIELLSVTGVYSAVIMMVAFIAVRNIGRVEKKYREDFLTDDDRNWIWGLFYYNKNDRKLLVNKRDGGGVTCNMARPAGMIIGAGALILTAVSLIGAAVWVLILDFTPVSLKIEENSIVVEHVSKEYEISLDKVVEVELIDELPKMSKQVGTGMDTLKKGKFSVDREVVQVCVRVCEGPYIMVVTDEEIFYLGDENPEDTIKIYEEMRKTND